MKNVLILATVLVVAAKVIMSLSSSFKTAVTESPEDYSPKKRPMPNRSLASDSKRINRNAFNPANPTSDSRPDYQVTERSGGNDPVPGDEPELDVGTSPGGATSAMNAPGSSQSTTYSNPSRAVGSTSSSSPSTSKSTTTMTSGTGGVSSLATGYGGIALPRPITTATKPTTGPTSTGTTSSTPVAVSCDASLGAGTYQNPSSVTLTCTTAATLKYCIQENTCCDPRTSGTTYTGAFTIGTAAKTYCLSFYGTTSSTSSSVVQKNYVFNPAAPNLTATHDKRYYQTTQLQGLAVMTSTSFGNAEFNVGQINTQNRDPGPSGLNLTCSALVDTYQSLTPLPVETFVPTSMSGFLPSDQIEVFLRLPKLVYGNNFITSFAVHVNYVERAACSTTRVVLQDFPYFVSETAHGDIGTNTVREFSGGFSSLGFFEADDTNLNRGPAGESVENQSGQELRTGLFGVFF